MSEIVNQMFFAEIQLSTTVTLRTAMSGWKLSYDGNDYIDDGTFVSVSGFKETIENVDNPMTITLNSKNNSAVMASIKNKTYRYGDVTIWKGSWVDGALTKVRVIKEGFIDTFGTPSANGEVEIIINGESAKTIKPRNDTTAQVIHNEKLKSGVYGEANKTKTDNIYLNSGKDFSQLTLGGTIASSYQIQVGGAEAGSIWDDWFGFDPEYETISIASVAGISLTNSGKNWKLPITYGKTPANWNLIDAFNPTEAQVFAKYGSDWNSGKTLADGATKYLTEIVTICRGGLSGVDSVQMFSSHSDETYDVLTSSGADKQTTYITDGNGKKVMAITVLRGTSTQEGFGTDNIHWRDDTLSIGVVSAEVTMLAWSDWPNGIPQLTFVPSSIKIRSIVKTGDVYTFSTTRSAVNTVGEVTADYLTNPIYGVGADDSRLNLKTFYDANNANDGLTNDIFPTHLRGTISGGGDHRSKLAELTSSFGMKLFTQDGKYSLYHQTLKTSSDIVKHFVDDSGDKSSNCTIKQNNARARKSPNYGIGTYNAIFHESGKTPALIKQEAIVSDEDALEEDKNIQVSMSMTFPFLTIDGENGTISAADEKLITELVNYNMQRQRLGNNKIEVYTTYDQTEDIKLGDLVDCESELFEWTGADIREFTVVGIEDDNEGGITLFCNEFSNETLGGEDSFTLTTYTSEPTTSEYSTTLQNNESTGEAGVAGADGSYNITVYKDSATKPSISGGTPSTTSRTELAVLPITDWEKDPTAGTVDQRWKAVTVIDPTVVAAGDKKEKATFTEDPTTVTGGSISSAIAQVNTTLYNSGTSGNASGSTTVAEEGFLDIDGDFPAANYPTTRDSLKATFSVGSETEFTFDDFEAEQSYTISLSGFTFPATSAFAQSNPSNPGFVINGSSATTLNIVSRSTGTSGATAGSVLVFISDASSLSDLATKVAAYLNAIETTDSGNTTPLGGFDVSRDVDVTADGADLIFTYRSLSAYSESSITNASGTTSTITNTAAVLRPRNAGYDVTLSGFTFPIAASQFEISAIGGAGGRASFSIEGDTINSIGIGMDAFSTDRRDELTWDGSNILYYLSSNATSLSDLASKASVALQALSTSGSTINHVTASNSTTYTVTRDSSITSSGEVISFVQLSNGSSTASISNTGATSTIENFAYVAEPSNSYIELTLSDISIPSTFTDSTVRLSTTKAEEDWFHDETSDTTIDQIEIGTTTTSNVRKDQITRGVNGDKVRLHFISDLATSMEDLASRAQVALQAVLTSGSVVNARFSSDTSTHTITRSVNVSSSSENIRFTRSTSASFTDGTIINAGGSTTTITNVAGVAQIVLPDYSTTALVADRIVSQGYSTGVTLTVDNTYDIVANPLGSGDVRIKFVYDTLGTQTDVTSASFIIVQGTDGTLTLEDVDIVTQGGGVTHVGDTLAINNVDTENGHSASAANVTLANDITGDTVQDAIDTLWSGLGGFTIDKTASGTVLATDNDAGDSSDPVLVHTPGTGSTLVISSSVTTQGVDGGVATGTNTNTTTVAGVDYLTVFGVGIGGSARATAVYNTLNAASAVTDDYDLVIDGDTWSIERKIFGNETDVTSVIDTGKTNQTAVDPTFVRIQGVLTDLVWSDVVEDGIDGAENANGIVYFMTAQVSAPSTPSATSKDFSTGVFTGLTSNWTTVSQSLVITTGSFLWKSDYSVSEDTPGGNQTITFTTPTKLAEFVVDNATLIVESDVVKVGSIEPSQISSTQPNINVSGTSGGTTSDGADGATQTVNSSFQLVVSLITANGGSGGTGAVGLSANGGDGGTVTITSSIKVTVTGSINVNGGAGGTAAIGASAKGGNGGGVTINAPVIDVSSATISQSSGGAGFGGGSTAGGTGGSVTQNIT